MRWRGYFKGSGERLVCLIYAAAQIVSGCIVLLTLAYVDLDLPAKWIFSDLATDMENWGERKWRRRLEP